MSEKPSYETLEQRVRELEKAAIEQKQRGEELQLHAVELERANHELKHLIDKTSHDLQEPLDVVMSYLRFVVARYMGRLDEDSNEFIASALDGVSSIQKIVTDLSAYSNISYPEEKGA